MQAFICAIYSFRGLHSNYYNIQYPGSATGHIIFLPEKKQKYQVCYVFW